MTNEQAVSKLTEVVEHLRDLQCIIKDVGHGNSAERIVRSINKLEAIKTHHESLIPRPVAQK